MKTKIQKIPRSFWLSLFCLVVAAAAPGARADEVSCELSVRNLALELTSLSVQRPAFEGTMPSKPFLYELRKDYRLSVFVWRENGALTASFQAKGKHELSAPFYFEASNLKLPINVDFYDPASNKRYLFHCAE